MAGISKRIETARRAVEGFRPCTMVVTMTDGTQITTDSIGAIKLFESREDVARVDADRDDYANFAALLTALCGGQDDAERA